MTFHTLLLKTSYLFYGYQTATTGPSGIFVNGDLITPEHPMAPINSEYNLIYSSNGAMIYGPHDGLLQPVAVSACGVYRPVGAGSLLHHPPSGHRT